ncbi:MAG TPA: Hsp20/alpha crystallin family protein [Vicinamibacteria bacterium]|nr:Hsp20/alpha crystallin family protein [Vicinamibacteria bacterium]
MFDPFETAGHEWTPQVDVYRTPAGFLLKFDLAGVRLRDVTITVKGSAIRVSGVRRDRFVERGYRHHALEISYSRFEREVRLPCLCEGATMTTEYDEGMLIVNIELDRSDS